MATRYITKDGDMLDAICVAFYGRSKNVTEQVLDHNPRLADIGPIYSAGIEILLPEFIRESEHEQVIRLWD